MIVLHGWIQLQQRAIIFDLDGTLLDTLDDLADSGNQVLAEHGLPTHPVDAYRYFVGDGVEKLTERMLPAELATPENVAEYGGLLRETYLRRWRQKTRPYDGIDLMLQGLLERGIHLAVLSNKPHPITQEVVAHFFSDIPFARIDGAKPEVPKKPHPAGAVEIAAHLGLDTKDIWYVGDTSVDMQTALAAGMLPVGAAWGFRPDDLEPFGARLIVERPQHILEHL